MQPALPSARGCQGRPGMPRDVPELGTAPHPPRPPIKHMGRTQQAQWRHPTWYITRTGGKAGGSRRQAPNPANELSKGPKPLLGQGGGSRGSWLRLGHHRGSRAESLAPPRGVLQCRPPNPASLGKMSHSHPAALALHLLLPNQARRPLPRPPGASSKSDKRVMRGTGEWPL